MAASAERAKRDAQEKKIYLDSQKPPEEPPLITEEEIPPSKPKKKKKKKRKKKNNQSCLDKFLDCTYDAVLGWWW